MTKVPTSPLALLYSVGMTTPDLSTLRDKAELSIQTLAVVFLGWLATSIASLDVEISSLNEKMAIVVTKVETHDTDIRDLKVSLSVEQKHQETLRQRLWDAMEKLRANSRNN